MLVVKTVIFSKQIRIEDGFILLSVVLSREIYVVRLVIMCSFVLGKVCCINLGYNMFCRFIYLDALPSEKTKAPLYLQSHFDF